MKNLILKWLKLDNVLRLDDDDYIDDCITTYNSRRYDIDGMASRLDDMGYSIQELESKDNDLEDIKDKMEDLEIQDIVEEVIAQVDFDKIQELDDRLTELLAGYKLEVKLTQEEY